MVSRFLDGMRAAACDVDIPFDDGSKLSERIKSAIYTIEIDLGEDISATPFKSKLHEIAQRNIAFSRLTLIPGVI